MYRNKSEVSAETSFLSAAGASPQTDHLCAYDENIDVGRIYTLKRVSDICVSIVALTVLLPLFAIVGLGIWASSRGPIFFKQSRIGRGGRSFDFYKFRSMVVDSEAIFSAFLDSDAEARSMWERYQKVEKDPRITPFGRFIRRTSLDELPQFWNVLKGDMSLVGPRPVTPAEKARYAESWRFYCAVRPGLTGLWQVSGRSALTYEARVQLDVQYVKNVCLRTDLAILLRTVRVVLTADGAH